MDKFYCNWVEGTDEGGHYKHPTWESARDEASRLAYLPNNRGRNVYVLECIEWCEVPETPIVWHAFVKEG